MKLPVDRIYVAAFAFVVVAPLLQMLTQFAKEPLVEERREPRTVASFLRRTLEMDPRLAGDVNGWFDDRYGFRSLLIRIKNEIDYQAFGVSDKVIIGKAGWLFDKKYYNNVVEDARDVALDQQIGTALRNLRDRLGERGTKLVFVLNAAKTSIYPQFLPTKPAVDPPTRLARRIAETLKRTPGITFVDGEEIISKHLDAELYYKTDIHMNFRAASFVYREMIAQIAQILGQNQPPLPRETLIRIDWNGGSEERYLAKLFAIADTAYLPREPSSAGKSDEFDEFRTNVGSADLPKYPDLPLYDVVFINKRSTPLLPPIVLFGTSFADPLFALNYNRVFGAIYRTRSNVPERICSLMLNMPREIKVFVVEFPEMFLRSIPDLDPATCPGEAHGHRPAFSN